MSPTSATQRDRAIRLSHPVIPDEYADILHKAGFSHMATLGPDGAPQTSPVWYDWDGDHLLVSQTTSRKKLENLKRDPRVALSILDPDNPYRYLEIRGKVAAVEPDEGFEFINSLAKKYLGQDKYPWIQPGEERVVVKIEPLHTSSMG